MLRKWILSADSNTGKWVSLVIFSVVSMYYSQCKHKTDFLMG